MTTHISPRATADKLVADYKAQMDDEASDGIMVMHHDNNAIEEVRDSAIEAELRGEFPRTDYRGGKA